MDNGRKFVTKTKQIYGTTLGKWNVIEMKCKFSFPVSVRYKLDSDGRGSSFVRSINNN